MDVHFSTTLWTTVLKAKRADPASVERLVNKYRPPVINFCQTRGLSAADSDDVAQEVFLRLLQRHVLHAADSSKGKFRSLLLAITRNVISEHRRGDKFRAVSIEASREDSSALSLDELLTKDERDEEFDRLWALHLIKMSMDTLKSESREKGTPYYEALMMFVEKRLSHRDIAEKLGKPETVVKNYIHRAKNRIRELFSREVFFYSSSKEEYSVEMKYLQSFFDGQLS